ncbi:hypothetical protein LDENG_00213920, partial [Lucifuga dentata]
MVAAAGEWMQTLCNMRRYEEAELLLDSAMEFYSYGNKPKRKELENFGLLAAFLDNYYKAYDYM